MVYLKPHVYIVFTTWMTMHNAQLLEEGTSHPSLFLRAARAGMELIGVGGLIRAAMVGLMRLIWAGHQSSITQLPHTTRLNPTDSRECILGIGQCGELGAATTRG